MAKMSPGLKSGAAGAGVIAVAGGLFAYAMLRTPETGPAPEAVVAAPAQPAPAPPPPASTPSPAVVPGFDVVRVTPEGAAIVAGRAEPGAKVTISSDAGPLAQTTADASGEFVAVFDAPPGDAPRTLRLETEDAAGMTAASPDVVVLVPPAPRISDDVASAEPDDATPVPAATEPADPSEAAPATPEIAATVLLRADGAVATPTSPGAKPGALTLVSISYTESGLVTLAGFGAAGAPIRAYVDDRFARDGAVGADGRWTLDLGDVAAGVYRLRIDALRPDGAVASRVETPFQRDFPTLRPSPRDGGGPATSITVQPGNNLWTLAREHYGSGVLYTQIHTANRDLIRDPELIYPGQIFVLPEGAPTE